MITYKKLIESFLISSGRRDIAKEYQVPTSSQALPMMETTMGSQGGTQSLTNSPLMIGKARRGDIPSAVQGISVYNGRERQRNMYGLQQPASLNHDTDFLLNVQNQSVNINTSHSLSMSRDRRLSGSQQPGVCVQC